MFFETLRFPVQPHEHKSRKNANRILEDTMWLPNELQFHHHQTHKRQLNTPDDELYSKHRHK